jgi:uncharacterized membrane protein
MNPSFRESGAFDSIISVAAFILLDKFFGLPWAIAGVTVWSLKAAYVKHRKGQRIGWLLPVTTLFLIARGAVGIIFDSRALYFGTGIAAKAAIGLALIGSVLIGKGVGVMYAHRVLPFPDEVRAHRIYRSTLNQLTVLAGCFEMGSAGWDVWLYNHSSKSGFVLIRFIVSWVSGFVTIFGAIFFADWRLRRIPGFGGLLELAEATLEHRNASTAPARLPAPDATSQGDR